MTPSAADPIVAAHVRPAETDHNEAHGSGVSWSAVIAGAFVMAAVSLGLLALGTGVGFSAVSPWGNSSASTTAIGRTAIGWFVLMQVLAASIAGYLTGRLRTRWVHVHSHEVFFRDTAHGFLAWAVSLVITAAALTSAAGAMAGHGVPASSGPSTGSAAAAGPDAYVVDSLLRTTKPVPDAAVERGEVGRILANGVRQGSLPAADRSYLAQLVVARAATSEADAEKRVDDAFEQVRRDADAARRAIAHSLYWTFVGLLAGAFCASVTATLGGMERDRVVVV